MKCKVAVVLGVAVLLTASRSADALVFFRPLVGKDVGHASWWPEGLKEVVLSHPRVGGQETDAPTWGNGMVSVELYFAGDQAAFNEFLARYSKIKAEKLVLILHPGKGVYRVRSKKGDKLPSFDWRVAASVNGSIPREGVEQTTHFSVNYYLGERGYTMGLEVPHNVVIVPSYTAKQREANPDDPTMNAIDTFIELHQKRAPRDN